MSDDELKHYRTPGSKNGVRLYQNQDGSLTPAGERRYLKGNQWNKHGQIKFAIQNKSSNSSTMEKIVKYTPGKVGNLFRAVEETKKSANTYLNSLEDKPSKKPKITIWQLKKFVYPVQHEIDKAVYFANKKVNDLTRDDKSFNEGVVYTNKILSKSSDYLQNPTECLIDLLKYLNKKSNENLIESHKHDNQIKSPSNWMSFGGRPRIKQTR